MSATPSEPGTTPEEYRQRALLFADLGRYDEAAGEVAAGLVEAPADVDLLATLARVHLVADQPAEALVAAERAAAGGGLAALVVRAMALADNRRFGEAARVASEILTRWPADAYAQRTGAALLSESRNGQDALNAAWNGVRSAPTEAEAHLVLAVVAARLRLFELAQRAYAEALELDESIGEAQRDVGIVRLERRRWARALEELAEGAAIDTSAPPPRPEDTPPPSAEPAPARTEPVEQVIRPAGPVLDPAGDSRDAVRLAVLYGSNGVLVAALLTALMAQVSEGAARVWAGLIGVLVAVAVLAWLSRRLTEPIRVALGRLRRQERLLAFAANLAFVAPALIVVYAVVGGLLPLIGAMVVAAVAEGIALTRR